MSACRSEVPNEQAASPTDADSLKAPPQPAEATPLAPAGRAELIAAFARAADATAAGSALPETNRTLVGRTFSLKLPFGCNGAASKDNPAWAGWTFDNKRQALKLTATPERWTNADWIKSMAEGLPHEAVEGFWIERPWTSSEDCPTGSASLLTGPEGSSERNTVGIAQFFAPDSPRTFQRGSRAYAHTIRVREQAEIDGRSYNLVVSGRVTGFPDGQPIHCVQDSPDLRPVCLMAMELARVSFEDPRDGRILADWRN